MAGRTDPHRVGAIVPADYDYVLSFSGAHTANGWPVPSVNFNLIVELRKTEKFADIHGTTTCDICGAWFIHGDVWRHRPTGELITLGHMCAEKYEMAADRADWAHARGMALHRVMQAERRRQARAGMREVLVAHPGLGRALRLDHRITRDIRARFIEFGTLSPKQVDLVHKLVRDAAEKAREDAEPQVEAPTGRLTVRGTVLGTRYDENGFYGPTTKMLVKVTTEAGSWKAWGTVPRALLTGGELKGSEIEFTAAFERSDRDPHFAFYRRPTKAILVDEAPAPEPVLTPIADEAEIKAKLAARGAPRCTTPGCLETVRMGGPHCDRHVSWYGPKCGNCGQDKALTEMCGCGE
jgi:hypothetical protein